MGQLLNFDKCSTLYNEKLDPNIMEGIKDCLSVRAVAFEAKYLGGLPTPEGRMKTDRFKAF